MTKSVKLEISQILEKSIEERLAYFKQKRIGHASLLAIRDKLSTTIKLRAGVDMAIVAGPTGVGKSTLVNIFQEQVECGQIDHLRSDPGCMPVVVVEAPAPETSVFGWKDFYVRIMEALGEPLIGKKINVEMLKGPVKANLLHPNLSTAELRRITEKCLMHRKTSVLVVDEAQHMFRVGSSRRLMDCLETLKSFASYGTVFVVLVGTYDLTNALELNGQLGRRTRVFNFARYDRQTGFQGFLQALKAFQDRLPLRTPADLITHAEYILETTLGLVGVLKNHIERTLSLALEANADTITLNHLQAAALAPRARLEIAREIRRGEEFFIETQEAEAEARRLLGIESSPVAKSSLAPKKQRHKPGERKGSRDLVGVEAESV